jgi:formylglycine-generating enzyme required for sulfatase activity/predicted MPP superfamily phosphohydrolase
MSLITWIHISDLHLEPAGHYNANVVLTPLLRDIADRRAEDGLSPDFIVATGDITYSGQPEEYAVAEQFFDELLEVTRVPKERFFVVPGNHDVDRRAISMLAERATSVIRDREDSHRVLSDKDDRALVLKRLHNYAAFVNRYFEGRLEFSDEQYFYAKCFEVGGRSVAVLGLNSAWLSSAKDDRNNLRITEKQVREALNKAKAADLRIALMHHPFDWLHDDDRGDVQTLLCAECHFVLHGHLHDVGLLSAATPDSETMVFAGGACYAGRKYPNAYNFVRLDLNSLRGKVYLRMYSDRQGGFWTKDVINYQNARDGEYQFKLPKVSMAVAKLVSRLKDQDVEQAVLDELVRFGPEAVAGLTGLIEADFASNKLEPTALNLQTVRQQRAFAVLSRMTDKQAVGYLSSLTPPKMVFIPAGAFLMGSDRFDNERPAGEVWVNSFYMARLLVTNDDYRKFIEAGGYNQRLHWTAAGWAWLQKSGRQAPWRWTDSSWRDQPNHPVQWLTWWEATAYAKWIAGAAHAPIRLPTEAEWEKAAAWDGKSKSKLEYPWGNQFDPGLSNLGGVWTTPVGRFSPAGDSPYGLADMVGQVWQWVSSIRKPYPYIVDDGREDPEADGQRVIRGGCWANHDSGMARCASRYASTEQVWPDMNRDANYEGPCGLRLALGKL